ncbi:dITP/XTP pyrophosphatase [compost metagenome]
MLTSNQNKIKEFKRFGLDNLNVSEGPDLKEVNSDPITVIMYKSKDSGPFTIVEDTSLHIKGESVGVNVKWMLDHIESFCGKEAYWEVLLGVNDGKNIEVYGSRIYGTIVKDTSNGEEVFGFDAFFKVSGVEKTLHELNKEGLKDNYSARKDVVIEFIKHRYFLKQIPIKDIPEWDGEYQNV